MAHRDSLSRAADANATPAKKDGGRKRDNGRRGTAARLACYVATAAIATTKCLLRGRHLSMTRRDDGATRTAIQYLRHRSESRTTSRMYESLPKLHMTIIKVCFGLKELRYNRDPKILKVWRCGDIVIRFGMCSNISTKRKSPRESA